MYLFICLSIYQSVHLSIYLFYLVCILGDVGTKQHCLRQSWQQEDGSRPKRSLRECAGSAWRHAPHRCATLVVAQLSRAPCSASRVPSCSSSVFLSSSMFDRMIGCEAITHIPSSCFFSLVLALAPSSPAARLACGSCGARSVRATTMSESLAGPGDSDALEEPGDGMKYHA